VSDERLRLFVALELPEAVREELVGWRSEALRPVPGLRLVAPEALHVTLCFLGSRPASDVDAVLGACGAVAGLPPCPLRLGEAVWLPPRRPGVLAVDVVDVEGRLAEVQAELSRALAAGGWYVPESRPFRAHVTVARVGRGARVPRGVQVRPPPELGFEGGCVTLFRSRPGPGGARYEGLGTVALGSDAGPADPLSVVRRFHLEQARAYRGAGLDGLRSLLDEEVVWHVPGRSRIAGEHRGVDTVLAYLELRSRMTDATFRVVVHGMALIAGRVVQLAGGRAVRDGREVSWETVGVFRVAGGRVAECRLVPFDQEAFDEIWG
jgi:RNA 2',3'-cyclic 3'-phosphodiesterase